MQLTIVWW